MPLAGSDAILKEMLKGAFENATQAYESGDSSAYIDVLCDGLAKAIVNHIVANAMINTTVTGSCSTGPITGMGIGNIK